MLHAKYRMNTTMQLKNVMHGLRFEAHRLWYLTSRTLLAQDLS